MEDDLLCVLMDADAAVAYLHAPVLSAPPAGEQDGSGRGVTDGVAEKVVHDPFEQLRVGQRPAGRAVQAERQTMLGGVGCVPGEHVFELTPQVEGHRARRQDAGVEARNVEQAVEQPLHRLGRGDQPFGDLAAARVQILLCELG